MHDYNALRAALGGPFAPLAQYRQFMLWRLEPNVAGGKPRKIPYAIDGRSGSSTDPSCWVDAATALDVAERSGMGLAFTLTDADPFVFIDVDGCVSGGAWDADALNAFARFPGAAFEASQSGQGMHLFVSGDTPEGYTGRKRGKFECYRTGRYVALTGNMAQGAIYNYGATLGAFIAEKFPLVVSDADVGPLKWQLGPIAEWQGPIDDEILLKQFLEAPQPASASQAFAHLAGTTDASHAAVSNRDLYEANAAVLARAYPSDKSDAFDRSQAAFALACRLAYWTGKDCPRIERLMNAAAFRRSKADQYHSNGVTYMHWDIMRACAMTTKVRFERAVVANADVVADAAGAFDAYYDRVAQCGDIHAMRALCAEIAVDLRIDPTFRETLAAHVQQCLTNLGHKLPIVDCRKLVALRSAHPAPDRQAMQRQSNIALNLPEDMTTLAPVMTTSQMLDEFVLIADGSQVGSIYDRAMCFSLPDFRNMLAASRTFTPDGKCIEHVEDWRVHPARKMVATRTFRAGAGVLTYDPNGRTALNSWRPLERGAYSVDIGPFLEQVRYLFGEATDRFLDWIAHIEQQPGVLPHHGFLHIADHFGTGRNWLESVIARLWRGYVAPSVNMDALINGGFNGSIAGRVIAIVDEIRVGAREDAYTLEGQIRNMVTEETRNINPKYGRAYIEHNACRWLLFSNHKNAIPMSDKDRRWDVVHLGHAPREPHVYSHLYGLLDTPGFVDSIGAWLRMRDLARFNPGARPPLTEAKLKAIGASKSDYQRLASQLVTRWPCDLITVSDASSVMNEGDMQAAGKRMSAAMRHAMEDAGMHYVEMPIYDDNGNKQRCWIVRNVEAWLPALTKENTARAFGTYRPHAKLTGYMTLTALL